MLIVAAFYNFVSIDRLELCKSKLLSFMDEQNIVGTIILAPEGLNGTVCGSREAIDLLVGVFKSNNWLNGMEYKELESQEPVFDKIKVKIKKEIVTFDPTINPSIDKGTYVEAKDWDSFVSNSQATIVDVRNSYEVEIGTFKNALNPNTTNFTEFKQFTKDHLMDKKDKIIGMACTGGVRCEKSTAYLKSLGFKKVYHLKGGILRYMQEVPEQNRTSWQGECFVFDHRRSVKP